MKFNPTHDHYNKKFCELSFVVLKGTTHMVDVEPRDLELAKKIFKEMEADTTITLSDRAKSLIRQLDTLPGIGIPIKEPLLMMTIDYVLQELA